MTMNWQMIPGWFDWQETYKSVVDLYRGGILIEVGTYLGRSLCCLGQMVKESGKPFQVVGVDWCVGSGPETDGKGETRNHHAEAVQEGLGSFAGTLHKNVMECGLSEIVSILVADSIQASKLFLDNTLTMVWLDSRHDKDHLKREIQAWLPKVQLGGCIGGDDMGVPGEAPVWPGVKAAVQESLPNFHYVPHDCWCYYKT